MAIQEWSKDITIVELAEDPLFSEEIITLLDNLDSRPCHVVLNFAAINFINSSNIARLLRIRKILLAHDRKLLCCGINSQVWGIILITGLDKIFEVANDVATALAILQMFPGKNRKK